MSMVENNVVSQKSSSNCNLFQNWFISKFADNFLYTKQTKISKSFHVADKCSKMLTFGANQPNLITAYSFLSNRIYERNNKSRHRANVGLCSTRGADPVKEMFPPTI